MKKVGIIALMMVLMVAGVYATTCAIVSPASSSTISGATLFNITTSDAAVTTCSVLVRSVKAADSMTVTALNATGGNYANVTSATSSLLDSNDYTVSATCTNGTTITCTGSKTGIIVDNTAPTCTYASGLVSDHTYSSEQAWTATCANARTATLKFGTNPDQGMVISSGLCLFTGSKLTVPTKDYDTVVLTVTDYTNTTTCTLTDIVIDDEIGAVEVGALVGNSNQQITTTGNGLTNKNVIVVVIGGLVLVWWMKRKK